MTRLPVLADDALRRALITDGLGAPNHLLTSIAEEVARTPQRPGVLAWRPWMFGEQRRWPALVLTAAAAVLALLAGLLLTSGGRPQPISLSSLVLPPLVMDIDYDIDYLAIGYEDAWLADSDGRLWHGAAAGWTGPERSPRPGIRALGLLVDGRLVVSGDLGTRVREPGGDWTVLGTAESSGLAVDSSGIVWVSEVQDGVAGFAGYGEHTGGWDRTWVDCPAGGLFVAAATDGTIWTGGFAYAGRAGLARFDGTQCEKVFVLDWLTHDVYDLAAGPNGLIVAQMGPLGIEPPQPGDWTGSRTVLWNGSAWTTLASPDSVTQDLAIGPEGDVFDASYQRIRRYRDGRWETVVDNVTLGEAPAFGQSMLATDPDGTLWYASRQLSHSLAVERIPTAGQPN